MTVQGLWGTFLVVIKGREGEIYLVYCVVYCVYNLLCIVKWLALLCAECAGLKTRI